MDTIARGLALRSQASLIGPDPTGLVGQAGLSKVLNEDSFRDGDLRNWTTLWTPGSATDFGTLQWINRSGTPRMALRVATLINGSGMGIKRMDTTLGEGRYLAEFLVSVEYLNLDQQYPRYFSVGVDTAASDGTRRFFEARFLNYDEAGAAAGNKWQLNMGGNTFQDAGAFTLVANENKALPVYVALVINTSTGKYEGLRVGSSLKLGSLAATPDNTLIAYGAMATTSLTTFAGGLNPFFSLTNRSSGTKTKGQMNLHWQRTTYLGA